MVRPLKQFCIAMLVLSSVLPAWAQFAPGQTVYYKYVGEWREAKVIRQDASGVYIQVRNALTAQWDHNGDQYRQPNELTTQKPAEFDTAKYGNENGALKPAAGWNPPAQAAPAAQAQAQFPGGQNLQPANAVPNFQAQNPAQNFQAQNPAPAAQQGAGGAVMSQGDVLGFLQANLGADAFAVPWERRQQIYNQLVQMIKSRGVNFHYEAVGPYADAIGKFGIPTEIVSALKNNYGTPVQSAWYVGSWKMDQHGAPTGYVKDNRAYERQYFGQSGTLKINADGTYFWNSASGPIRGTWRKAQQTDFKGIDKGGAGIVLTRAKTGTDWIVYEDDKSPGQSIVVSEVGSPDHQEVGGRM